MQQREFLGPAVTRLAPIIVFVIAIAIYANTLTHGFVLDDEIVITKNSLVQQGTDGLSKIFSEDSFYGYFNQRGKSGLIAGGRYRPLTIAMFALIHQAFGQAPFPYHAVAVLVYALTCIGVFYVFRNLLQMRLEHNVSTAALLSAVVFTVLPVHTEVVANIKGLDETVALGCSILALLLALRATDSGKYIWSVLAAGTLFFACLSKENAVAFAVIIPVALIVFRRMAARKALVASVPLFIAAGVYVLLRSSVIGAGGSSSAQAQELMNNPFLVYVNGAWQPMQLVDRIGLLLSSFARYTQLIIAQYPLTHDYYPATIRAHGMGNPSAIAGFFVAMLLLGSTAWGLRLSKPWAAGLFGFLASFGIVSNVIFPIGTIMGERFLFMPSFGIALSVATALPALLQKPSKSMWLSLFGAVVAVYTVLTVSRNGAWKDNETLFFTDIAVSRTSAKLNSACGGELLTRALASKDQDSTELLASQAFPFLDAAIVIHPTYGVAFYNRATCNILVKNYRQAVEDARVALRFNGDVKASTILLARALRDRGKYEGETDRNAELAITSLLESWQLNPTDAKTAHLLGIGYGILGKHTESLSWFSRAVDIAPQDAQYVFDLGTAYYYNGNKAKRDEYHKRAQELR